MPSSPDIPAYYSYLIVALVGGVVARSTVNSGLADYPDGWSFFATWQLFLAYTALPVLLFWFLDYTSVIQDTSLFAALLVAAGYQSIFTSGIQSISMPGQSASLWKPFQAWVARINDRIATKQKAALDEFVRTLEIRVSSDPELLNKLQQVTTEHLPEAGTRPPGAALSEPADELQVALAAIPPEARLQRFRLLWRAFRTAEPINYGYILYRERLISPLLYWWQFRHGLADIITFGLLSLGSAIVLFSCFESSFPSYVVSRIVYGSVSTSNWTQASAGSVIRYYQWRLRKLNASDKDNFRSHEYVKLMASHTNSCDGRQAFQQLMAPVIADLCFKDEPSKKVDDVARLLVSIHSPTIDTIAIPRLLQCLWTDDADNRLRIHQTLIALQQADYPSSLSEAEQKQFAGWIPGKDEKSGDMAVWVKHWSSWWNSAQASQNTTCSAAPSNETQPRALSSELGLPIVSRSPAPPAAP
ncbi:MAG TPA: hypothetical protein VKS22_15890 [Candidatus Binataceae bacterium]|nr:hypothetical protein [Candidatus Binataceae bacterium]